MTPSDLEIIFQLVLAAIVGLILGFEREVIGKPAGMRTYALVTLGATIFTIISKYGFTDVAGGDFDPSRVAAQIVTGIGFLGAGIIIFRETTLQGLTTAAGMWVAAGVGIAVGFKLYLIAIFASILTLFAFTVMWVIENFIEEHINFLSNKKNQESTPERLEGPHTDRRID